MFTESVMSFGSLLRGKRRDAGLALEEVALHTGLTIAQLSRIERDREPPPEDEIIGILATTIGASDGELRAAANMRAQVTAAQINDRYALYRRSSRGWSR